MPTNDIDEVHAILSRIYGTVAAVMRDDRVGSDLLLHELRDSFENFTELLAAMSFATLDRLDAALEIGGMIAPGGSRALAQCLLTEAHRYAMSNAVPVQSAARRLDTVRRHDHELLQIEVEQSRSAASDSELLWGAVALLTAAVSLWAKRSGQTPRRAAADLCLAVSVIPAR